MTSRRSRVGAASALLLLVLTAACRGPRPERPVGSCTHVRATRAVRGLELCEDVWTCTRPPARPLDRIGLHRLAPCDVQPGPVVLYLPGMHMNGELPIREPEHDLRVYLAVNGLRTWGLDYRTHAVPADAPETDLDTLKRWTAEVFLDDIAWGARFVRGTDPGPLFVAGFSQGATFAYRLAAREPAGIAGLVILDGTRASGGAPGAGASRTPIASVS